MAMPTGLKGNHKGGKKGLGEGRKSEHLMRFHLKKKSLIHEGL